MLKSEEALAMVLPPVASLAELPVATLLFFLLKLASELVVYKEMSFLVFLSAALRATLILGAASTAPTCSTRLCPHC